MLVNENRLCHRVDTPQSVHEWKINRIKTLSCETKTKNTELLNSSVFKKILQQFENFNLTEE